MPTPRRALPVLLCAVLALGVAACGGDDDTLTGGQGLTDTRPAAAPPPRRPLPARRGAGLGRGAAPAGGEAARRRGGGALPDPARGPAPAETTPATTTAGKPGTIADVKVANATDLKKKPGIT